MNFLEFLFGSEEDSDDEEFENLVKEGKIKRENFNYKYRKPQLLETIEGDYDKFWNDCKKEAKIIIITGMRRSGKGVIGFSIAQNLAKANKMVIYSLGTETEDLPPFISNIDSIDTLENDCILLVSEGGIEANSRRSMTQENIKMNALLSVVSHKNIWLIYCTQTSAKLDVSLLRESDCIIMLEGSLMMKEMERPTIKKLYIKFEEYILRWKEKIDKKGICVIYSKLLTAVARFQKPTWYTTDLSKAYRDKEIK